MKMKRILKEWSAYLKENDSLANETEVRLAVAEKLSSILFAPIRNPREVDGLKKLGGPMSIIAIDYVYYVIYGTKAEPIRPPNIDAGKMYVEAKVAYFLDKLSNRERDILKADAHSLLDISNFGEFPTRSIKIPVELTGREGVPSAFKVAMFNGSAAGDWGMAGSLFDGSIRDYAFQLIADRLDATQKSPLSDSDLIDIYSKGLKPNLADDDDEPGRLESHPAAKMSYEELMAFIKSKQGK